MYDCSRHFINGQWVESDSGETHDIINPATTESVGRVVFGTAEDVNRAVGAARAAFPAFAAWTVEQRIELLERIVEGLKARHDDIARAISEEMGAPIRLARTAQAGSGLQHFGAALEALKNLEFHEKVGDSMIYREPIGVCGLITPWNWPINQTAVKVAPALAAGCTMILKPSEIAPVDATILAEVLDAAGVPPGVFNLVHGDGPGVGAPLSAHPDVDMMSFTGSTRAGVLVAKAAADTVKRVAQELGGKSANIILEDAPLEEAVTDGVRAVMMNTGQSCNAPTRMLLPASRYEEAVRIAAAVADQTVVGDPADEKTHMGPLVSEAQFDKVQGLIEAGIEEGARVVAGGPGRPDGLERGYYARPTVFADVNNDMTIAREEIFGPVLVLIPYETVDEAVRIANDTVYGLSGYVWGGSREAALDVARRLRTGMVHINGASLDSQAPFGGYKQSGNGREWGGHGIEEFLETKSVMGA
ncbi:aldehyde dehydrogenase family protein [Elongatibacter sediminis]|uniref:Aldehyde dehydrogenase family protein n=1 Tax=Elongatibacter sediminis TaxID=3119006 RepID=A0AAW9REG4_9GAMM